MTEPSRLPDGSVMIHIGPYKTGSTAIQAALAAARPELPRHGVVYPGDARRHAEPGWAVLDWSPRVQETPPISVWEDLVAEVHAATPDQRVVVSTEDFGFATPARIERIVGDLGADASYMTTVIRPLDLLLPSQWQEQMKSMQTFTYDAWLRDVLFEAQSPPAKTFWTSHDVERVLGRWLGFLPPERVIVVAGARGDRGFLPRSFEGLLGLPEGLLALQQVDNASLSPAGSELLRRLNAEYAEHGWTSEVYRRQIRYGAVAGMLRAGRNDLDGAPLTIPAWAVDRVRELSEQRVAAIREAGVRVVGDLDGLLLPGDYVGDAEDRTAELVSQELATAAVTGAIQAGLRDLRQRGRAQRRKGRRGGRSKDAAPPAPP
ncbi:MAG: hypothetical protein ACR2K3_00005, partial [Nocardioides sp.]